MATNNGSAEIVNMEDERARRRATELDPDEFVNAGAHLKAVREAAGHSLDELAEKTHIKARYLAAIETMTLSDLPSRPFAIGFVRGYAEALGLDPAAIVDRFKVDAGFAAAVEVEPQKFEAAQSAAEAAERPELSLWAVFAVVAFVVWCAIMISRPREATTPFSLNPALPPSAQADQPPILPSDEALQGVAPAPLPRVVEPVLIERIEPVYPRRCEADAAPVETVEIAFNITLGGVMSGERVASSSNSCFDEAALNAARRWRFSPRTVDGAPRPAYDQRYTLRFEKPQ